MAWSMGYGGLASLVAAIALGEPLTFDGSPAYVLSLLYLTVFGSILAFAGFLDLLGRVGPSRASYVGVMVPIVALLISSIFEGFTWQALTFVGVAISVAGNVLVLRKEVGICSRRPSFATGLARSRWHVNVFDAAGGLRNGSAVLAHAFEMQLNSFADLRFDFFNSRTGGDATRKVRHVSGVITFGLFDHDLPWRVDLRASKSAPSGERHAFRR